MAALYCKLCIASQVYMPRCVKKMHEVVTEWNETEAKTNISKDTNANYFLFVKDCNNSHIYFLAQNTCFIGSKKTVNET